MPNGLFTKLYPAYKASALAKAKKILGTSREEPADIDGTWADI